MLRLSLILLSLISLFSHAAPLQTLHEPQQLHTSNGTLYGSLLLPQSPTPVPVALLIAGSGPTDRDGNNPAGGNNNALKKLAQALAARGIASLRYDKRGVAASLEAGRDETQLSLEQYAQDAAAWAQQLSQDPRLGPVVLVGHSEGALIASLAAQQGAAQALVSIAGPGYPIADILQAQLAPRLPAELKARSDAILSRLKAGQSVSDVPPDLNVLFRPSVQPYLISLFSVDPAQVFAELTLPALIIQGSHDAQVSLNDAYRLQQANPQAKLAIIEQMNHVLRITPAQWAEQIHTYNQPNTPIAHELVGEIAEFIHSSHYKNGR